MLTKRLINLSINCRKLITAHKLKPIGSLCQVVSFTDHVVLKCSKLNKDHRIQLNDSTSSAIVLDLLEFNFKDRNLNSLDTIKALTKFVQLCKQETRSPVELVYEDFFKNLCDLINAQADDLTLIEAMQIMNLLQQLEVPSSLSTIPYLLHCVDKRLNTATFIDYNKIMEIIMKIPPIPPTEAMKTTLIKKFIFKISTSFQQNNFEDLVEAFKFACLYLKDKDISKMLKNALENNNFDKQSLHSIVSLMKTLSSLDQYSRKYDKVLTKAQEVLAINISHVNNEDILCLLKNSYLQIRNKRHEVFYNKTLYDKAIQQLIQSECNIEQGVQCLEALNGTKHISKEFVDYLSGIIYITLVVDKKWIKHSILYKLFESLADLKYTPFCWETILNVFRGKNILKFDKDVLLYRAYHLACLDCYESELLKALFQKKYNFRSNRLLQYHFLRLYQKLKTTPGYTGPMPTQAQIESFESLIRKVIDYPLYTSLKEALGGPEYIKNNIRTKLYHQIEHVVVFQPDGNPLPINDIEKQTNIENDVGQLEYLENLNIPENCQVICIVRGPTYWYSRNTNQLLGTFATYIETLQTLSCQVVTVPDKVWETLPKDSRANYLMDIIRNKLEENQLKTAKLNVN